MAGTFIGFGKDGQVPATIGALYTVPASTVAFVRTLRFYNTSATPQTVVVYLDQTGTDRKAWRFQLELDESAVIEDRLALKAGAVIEAETTTAGVVEYAIHGVEET
jgi:hypothetical protein